MDEVDARILVVLQQDGRISMRELGRGRALPGGSRARATAGTARRRASLPRGGRPDALGPAATSLRLGGPTLGCAARELEAYVQEAPEIQEGHRIPGEDCSLLRGALPDVSALQALLEHPSRYGRPRTSILLSSPVEGKPLAPLVVGTAHSATARLVSQSRDGRAVALARPGRAQPAPRGPRGPYASAGAPPLARVSWRAAAGRSRGGSPPRTAPWRSSRARPG